MTNSEQILFMQGHRYETEEKSAVFYFLGEIYPLTVPLDKPRMSNHPIQAERE